MHDNVEQISVSLKAALVSTLLTINLTPSINLPHYFPNNDDSSGYGNSSDDNDSNHNDNNEGCSGTTAKRRYLLLVDNTYWLHNLVVYKASG